MDPSALEEPDEDGDDADEPTPFTSRFGRELAKSRSSHFLKADSTGGDGDGPNAGLGSEDENLSSWARLVFFFIHFFSS